MSISIIWSLKTHEKESTCLYLTLEKQQQKRTGDCLMKNEGLEYLYEGKLMSRKVFVPPQ